MWISTLRSPGILPDQIDETWDFLAPVIGEKCAFRSADFSPDEQAENAEVLFPTLTTAPRPMCRKKLCNRHPCQTHFSPDAPQAIRIQRPGVFGW